MESLLLVTGASGQLGQAVLQHLTSTLDIPANRIVAASRQPERLASWAAKGVQVRELDFEKPASFAAALSGIERALLISTDTLDRPGQRLQQHQNAVTGFATAGVQHVVYTSAPHPEGAPLLIAPDHLGTEEALAASELPGWTVLRNHWYFENLAMSIPAAIASGQWYSADEGQGSADIARDDLALAAAVALSGTETGKKTWTLSGPESLTKQQIATAIAGVVNKPITVVQVPLESLVQGMMAAGLPEPLARILASFDANTAAGRVAAVTTDFKQLTGREPQTFHHWLENHRGLFTGER